jgi:asparagine synthase (glutamine-hydrolysing)
MANFLAIVEQDHGVREHVVRSASPAIAHHPGMLVRELGCGDLALLWAAHVRAPVTWANTGSSAALVLGDAIDGPSSRRVTAGELTARTWDGAEDIPGPSDGYFAALHYSAKDGLRVWADILGFFPVYHWTDGSTTIVGSSPELFRLHPRFRVRLSTEGLAGVLLINGLVANTAIIEGVRRLAVGHVFLGPMPGRAAREKEHYRIPLSHDLADHSLDDLTADFGDVLERACRRQAGPDGRASILLSGGLDSRVIAACAQRAGCALTALTFGKQGDQELRIAWGVGSALGLTQHVIDDSATAPVSAALSKVKWEHLANGFYRGTRWGMPDELASAPQPIFGGYAMDFLAGPKRMQAARVARDGGDPFQRQLQRQSRWGIGSGNIDPLLRTEGLAARLEAGLREHYYSFSPSASKTQWAHSLRHRARYHLGGIAWQIAMVSWPALPVLDRELLGLLGAMPMAAMSGRRLEADLLTGRFPVLAALPLDRNSHNTQPISPRLKYLLADAVTRRLPWRPSRDVLYYERLADINSPPWLAVRREAEPCRELVESFVDPEVLRRLLPGPDTRVRVKDVIIQNNGARLLLGLLLWSRTCLQ